MDARTYNIEKALPSLRAQVVENTVNLRSVTLGFHRYGHPDGPVYLPTDCGNFDNVRSESDYAPTWDQFVGIWLKEGDKRLPETTNAKPAIAKLRLAKSSLNFSVRFSDTAGPKPKQRVEQPEDFDVLCAPMLTTEVAQLLKSHGYSVDPLAIMPFKAQPIPFECNDKAMIIRLMLPQRPKGLWPLEAENQTVASHVLIDSLLLYVSEVHGTPTILSFGSPEDIPQSMNMTFRNKYWKSRFQDPERRDVARRLPLPFFWYAVRRWDEVFEAVDTFIGSWEVGYNPRAPQRLHVLRAYLSNNAYLLMRFKSILTEIQAGTEDQIVINECKKLLVECDRFDSRRKTNEERAKYIIDIIYSQSAARAAEASAKAAEASVRDSRDMKQVSRLTMLFLPASVMAGIFGIDSSLFNAQNSLIVYIGVTVPLTLVVIWLFVAMQVEHYFDDFPPGIWRRVLWPFYILRHGVKAVDSLPNV